MARRKAARRTEMGVGCMQRGAQLLKANRRRGLGQRQRGLNEPQERFINKKDRPHTSQGTRA